MSAAGRGAMRREADFYATPAWCTRRLLAIDVIPGSRWLEPCAGNGEIIDASLKYRQDIRWSAIELREECRPMLTPIVTDLVIGDFLHLTPSPRRYDAVVTNPPYGIAFQIAQRAVEYAPVVALQCRLNWLEGEERNEWLREHTPDVYVLPNRPSFTGSGTDATAYAWLVFRGHRRSGKIEVLPLTPLRERR